MKDYGVLLNELRRFNPDMLDKHRVLAITKCDMIDEELATMLREEIVKQIDEPLPIVFISAVAQQGMNELKDILWEELNSESNKLQSITAEDVIVHRDKDMSRFSKELADEGEDIEIEFVDEDEIEELEDYEIEDIEE